jgi:enamine deaminase RidA (YjgF/YER057c/UK114 family)
MEIQYLQPDGLVRSPAFSHGAVIPPGATMIYIGGQDGVDGTGKVVASHDAAAQAMRAVDNVETVRCRGRSWRSAQSRQSRRIDFRARGI